MKEMDGLEELRTSLSSFKLVPVIGAGVSIAAAKLPSWRGLIEQGIDYAAACGGCYDEEVNSVRNILATGSLLEAARKLKALLGAPGGQYATWLENVFSLKLEDIIDKSVPNAIADLLCPIIATTNYDHLLELMLLERYDSVTWKKPVSLLRALQKGQSVIHLHGSFLEPETVILGDDNYNELVFDKAYLDVMRSLWIDRTLLFIGCSFDGLEDPDFIRMLNWFKQTFTGTSHRHYALMLAGSFSKEQQRHWLHEFRVQVISYGPEHINLAEAIRSINVNSEQARAHRQNLSKAIFEKGDVKDRSRFVSLMEGTVPESERENLITAAAILFRAC